MAGPTQPIPAPGTPACVCMYHQSLQEADCIDIESDKTKNKRNSLGGEKVYALTFLPSKRTVEQSNKFVVLQDQEEAQFSLSE